jgi:hypothetical protein
VLVIVQVLYVQKAPTAGPQARAHHSPDLDEALEGGLGAR